MTDKIKKVGRPKKENAQDRRVTIRMNETTFKKFTEYCNTKNVTKSEAIRKAIDLL